MKYLVTALIENKSLMEFCRGTDVKSHIYEPGFLGFAQLQNSKTFYIYDLTSIS